jgi:uncharacterized membrane protein
MKYLVYTIILTYLAFTGLVYREATREFRNYTEESNERVRYYSNNKILIEVILIIYAILWPIILLIRKWE